MLFFFNFIINVFNISYNTLTLGHKNILHKIESKAVSFHNVVKL